jgi:hypothetical protein
MRRADMLVFGSALLLLAGAGFPARAAPIAAEEAIAAAGRVAAALDVPFGEGATANLEEAMGGRPEWVVEFHSFSRVRVSDEGSVRGVVDYTARPRQDLSVGKPPIPEEDAIAAATRVLEHIGLEPDLILDHAELSYPVGDQDIADWLVKWRRVYQGIPYEFTADANVMMDAATGKLILVSLPPRPPAPASIAVNVSDSEGVEIALAHVSGHGRALPGLRGTAMLEIAQPHLFWTGSDQLVEARYDDPSVVVWYVDAGVPVDAKLVDEGWPAVFPVAYVQVDAASGQVVGDALAGGRPPQASSAQEARSPAMATSARWLLIPVTAGGVAILALIGGLLLRARRAAAR